MLLAAWAMSLKQRRAMKVVHQLHWRANHLHKQLLSAVRARRDAHSNNLAPKTLYGNDEWIEESAGGVPGSVTSTVYATIAIKL